MSGKLLPCPHCGAEAWGGADTTVEVRVDIEESEQASVEEYAGKVCPECGKEFTV